MLRRLLILSSMQIVPATSRINQWCVFSSRAAILSSSCMHDGHTVMNWLPSFCDPSCFASTNSTILLKLDSNVNSDHLSWLCVAGEQGSDGCWDAAHTTTTGDCTGRAHMCTCRRPIFCRFTGVQFSNVRAGNLFHISLQGVECSYFLRGCRCWSRRLYGWRLAI